MLPVFLLWSLIQAPDTALALRAVRFYRADPTQSSGQTHVTAMLRIPESLPAPGDRGEVSLTLSVRVRGEDGKTLFEQTWQKRTAVPYPRGDADLLDVLRFTLGPGSYRLEASVADSVSGRRDSVWVPIEGYPAQPQASDLVLSPWLRRVAPVDTVPQPGEFRRGGLILAIAPQVLVGGPSASVAYLLETYSGSPLEGSLTITVVDGAGALESRSEPAKVRLAAGIGLLTGQVDVSGLKPGQYDLVANLDLGGHAITRTARFGLDPEAGSAPAALTDEAYFAGLSGKSLDAAFAPIAVIAPAAELVGWPIEGSDAAKRRFLVRFWKPRDPTPENGNERRARFYDGVSYVSAFFKDPARRREGWQTDRGRIFLREGLATQVLRRNRRGSVPPYEVWRYFDRGNRFYVFVDRGVLGGVILVRSNDPAEPGERRWQDMLTPEGVREVVGLLGRSVLTSAQ